MNTGRNPLTPGFSHTLIAAGLGGQGVLVIGNMVAFAAMLEGNHVTYLPLYGVEMRGGTADCTVVLSSERIGSPLVDKADCVVAMSPSALTRCEFKIRDKGLFLINSSLINRVDVQRTDVSIVEVPANDIALNNGNARLANMVALGAYVELTKAVRIDSILQSLQKVIGHQNQSLMEPNAEAIQKGVEYARSQRATEAKNG